jgi:Protein of unknown function (DUF2971)
MEHAMAAQVDIPQLPTRLYRYRSITRSADALDEELSAIIEGYVYCADFTRLNDPMEGSYNPTSLLKGAKNYKRTVERIKDRKVGLGIASFSEVKHGELMWTHYTGNHEGICVGYYSRNLVHALPHDAHVVRVGYFDAPPLVSKSEANLASKAARKIFSHKKLGWQYEREWRVLAKPGRVALDRDYNVVSAVYMGTRIRACDRRKITEALQPLKISLYRMEVEGYDHVVRRVLLKPRGP